MNENERNELDRAATGVEEPARLGCVRTEPFLNARESILISGTDPAAGQRSLDYTELLR